MTSTHRVGYNFYTSSLFVCQWERMKLLDSKLRSHCIFHTWNEQNRLLFLQMRKIKLLLQIIVKSQYLVRYILTKESMGKLQNIDVTKVEETKLLSFPYNRTVLIATKNTSSESAAKTSKSHGTGYCLSQNFVITSRFVVCNNKKQLCQPSEIMVYLSSKCDDEWLSFGYEVAEVVSLSQSMQKSVAILKLKTSLSLTQSDVTIGLIKPGKLMNGAVPRKIEVVGVQVKDWNFINPNTEVKHSIGDSMQVMQSLIYYKSSTELGFGGSPLIVEYDQKKYVIGLHFGANNKGGCNFGFCFTWDTMNELYTELKKMGFKNRIVCLDLSINNERIFDNTEQAKPSTNDCQMEEEKMEKNRMVDESSAMKEEQSSTKVEGTKREKRLADPVDLPPIIQKKEKQLLNLKWQDGNNMAKIKENTIIRLGTIHENSMYIVSQPIPCQDRLNFILSYIKPGIKNQAQNQQFFSFGFVFQKKSMKQQEPISQLINEKSFCYRYRYKDEGEILCDNNLLLRGPLLKLVDQSQSSSENNINFNVRFGLSTCDIRISKTKDSSQVIAKLRIDEEESFDEYSLLCFVQMTREGCTLKIKSERSA